MQVFTNSDLKYATSRRALQAGLHTGTRAANGGPVMTADPWRADAFGTLQMTDAINTMPYVAAEFDTYIDWDEKPSYTPNVAIDKENGQVYVVDYSPRGGALPVAKKPTRSSNAVEIPRIGERESLTNDSFIGVRETGGISLQTIEQKRDERLAMIQTRLAHSRAFQRAKALDNQIVDKNGNLIVDVNGLLGESQTVVLWDLTANPDVNELFVELKQQCEDTMGQFIAEDYTFITGRNANAALRTNASIKEAMKDYPQWAWFQREDNRKGYMLATDVLVVSAGRPRIQKPDGSFVGFIDESANSGNPQGYGVGYLVPNAPGFARTVFGPSSMTPFLGSPQEFYASREDLPHNQGVEILGETYTLSYFARPSAVIKVLIKY